MLHGFGLRLVEAFGQLQPLFGCHAGRLLQELVDRDNAVGCEDSLQDVDVWLALLLVLFEEHQLRFRLHCTLAFD